MVKRAKAATTQNLDTKSWSRSNIVGEPTSKMTKMSAKSSIALTMKVPWSLLRKWGFSLVTICSNCHHGRIKETSDSVEIKHTQSKMERKMKTQYSWPLKHNPLDCLQCDCHQASCRKWAKSWAPSLTMSRGVYILTHQMLRKDEQGLSLTDVDTWSTSCPVDGEKILKKFKTHVVAMDFNSNTLHANFHEKWVMT